MHVCQGAVAVLMLALAGLAQGQEDTSQVVIKTEKLADGVYMLTGAGGNIGVSVGADGIVIIDDQFAPLTPKIQAALTSLSPKPVRFVINTHWHFDHTGGNENFGRSGAVLMAHQNVRKRMSEKQFIELMGREEPASPQAALPVVTFTEDVAVHYNDEDLHVFHVANAHTDGDALIHFRKANVMHLGDTFFNGFYPFIDTSSGGSIDGMIASAEQVLAMVNADTKLIPGHGPSGSRADLQKFHDMLVALRTAVAKLIRQGKTLQQTIAAAPSRDLDAVWGNGLMKPDQVVQMVYVDLKRSVQ